VSNRSREVAAERQLRAIASVAGRREPGQSYLARQDAVKPYGCLTRLIAHEAYLCMALAISGRVAGEKTWVEDFLPDLCKRLHDGREPSKRIMAPPQRRKCVRVTVTRKVWQ
jgi:hypothetical protein